MSVAELDYPGRTQAILIAVWGMGVKLPRVIFWMRF